MPDPLAFESGQGKWYALKRIFDYFLKWKAG